jgi:Cu(I)/Ag(I) efflux system membrane fusion protein
MIIKYVTNQRQGCSFLALLLYLLFAVYSPVVFSSEKTDSPEISPGQSEMEAQLESMKRFASEHQDKVYACPMHPDEVSNKPGSCSICGMFLVAQETGGSGIDNVMHNHSNAANSDNHVEAKTKAKADMAQEHVPIDQKSKPALFWDSTEPRAMSNNEHRHTDPGYENQPVTQRLLHEDLPGVVTGTAAQNMTASPEEHARKHQDPTYICPMHPQIMQHEPGNCPICGMNLVPRESSAPAGDNPQVFLEATVIQNMGVRTAKVLRKVLDKQIRTQGLVTPDVDRLLSIHPRAGGWVERLYLLTEGDRVERKDELLDFHSPWINQVQLDFITALEEYDQTSFEPSRKTELVAKVDSLRNSLRLLNVMDMDIMRIENSRKVQNTIELMAPQGGVITRLNVSEGTYIEPYESMLTIVDLSKVWVMVDIYEHQAPWIRKGNIVKITAPAIPARSWNGVVDYIYPQVDPKTRTLRARITLDNPDEALLLNMFVQVEITANSTKQRVLTVPREAVILTGERETVIKSLGKGHFQPVDVKTGRRGEGSVEILSGLKQGDEIVVSGQFLIDSESSLQASFLRMSE